MEEVLGYFSSGDSIEVYVNTQTTNPDRLLQELCQVTGMSLSKACNPDRLLLQLYQLTNRSFS